MANRSRSAKQVKTEKAQPLNCLLITLLNVSCCFPVNETERKEENNSKTTLKCYLTRTRNFS